MEETSSDDDLSDWQRDKMDLAEIMVKSDNRVDQRLIDIYRIRKAHQIGINLGFSNPGARLGGKPMYKKSHSSFLRPDTL